MRCNTCVIPAMERGYDRNLSHTQTLPGEDLPVYLVALPAVMAHLFRARGREIEYVLLVRKLVQPYSVIGGVC
jgi:hypothetical protein